jgi:predicted amidohydrolase
MSSLSVSLIQSSLFWEDKERNLAMLEEKIIAIPENTNLVILPEMFSIGFSMKPSILAETMDGETIAWMKRIASSKKIILTGSIIIKDNEHYFNRLIWMLPNGTLGFYDKRHLFAFAGEDQYYTPGNKRLITSVNGWKINLQICYDLRFPVWARQQSKDESPEFDLLIYVANWPERRNYAWKTLLTARAIENQSYVIGVNRVGEDGNQINHSGDSMLIDPFGNILFTKQFEEVVQSFELTKDILNNTRNRFPFWKDADQFNILQDDPHA